MRNAPFEIRPIAGALGAELRGVDLSAELPDATIGAIRQALLDHLVLFFRDQELPPERFLSLARRFGDPVEYPFVKGIEGFPEIINVAKLEHEKINFGGVWHSDTTYLQEPPMATLLVARDVPQAGGDTIFANQYLALAALSDTLRDKLAGLRGVASSAKADASRTREDRIRSDGSADARRILMEPVGGRIWFAGEAVHETEWGTVAGAWDSGTRAAEAALRQMGVLKEPEEEERARVRTREQRAPRRSRRNRRRRSDDE